jgi:hypothetical protein
MSEDMTWKDRLRAEYAELHEKYLKLKAFNTKEEVSIYSGDQTHLAPDIYARELRVKQQKIMGEYLHTLELRAVLHHVDL